MSKICSFFGHRDAPESIFPDLIQQTEKQIVHGCTEFWCGGYGHFDSLAARAVRRLQSSYKNIRLCLLLPYLPVKKTEKFDWQRQQYDDLIFLSELEFVSPRFAIAKRNRLMVLNSDYVIFYVDHKYGGAYTALKYAKRQGISFINLAPLQSVKRLS